MDRRIDPWLVSGVTAMFNANVHQVGHRASSNPLQAKPTGHRKEVSMCAHIAVCGRLHWIGRCSTSCFRYLAEWSG
jgi:hypothetical protein